LLVVNSASPNPYGPYLAEILRAEGLNAVTVIDLSTLTASQLANVPLVLLAETPLTTSQTLLLTNYVAGGGHLVAMRPDAQLAPALGIVPQGTTTSEGYIGIATSTTSGAGFPSTTLPFHGQAQNNNLGGGATAVATLYRDGATATSFPAVVTYGRTATWAYDVATTVVYSRQGNPANAGVMRDGVPPLRTTDVFYQAIDLDRVSIPHADIHMRLLSRVIIDLLADTLPVPRLWYFPNAARTLLVPTSDSHITTQSTYLAVIASLESRGARTSLYLSRYISLPASLIATWQANGHEVGMHPFAAADGVTLDTGFTNALNWFSSQNWGTPSVTVRNHQIQWQGWIDAATVAAAHGMQMDLTFYTWGPSVTYADGHQAHGYINGSGLPMRFVDQTGTVLPMYQQTTSLIDEQLMVGPYAEALTTAGALSVSRKLIDDSQAGGYSAITTNWHVDYYTYGNVQPWIEGTLDYANGNGVPMFTAGRWLNYTASRAATTMTNLSWSAATKQLSVSVGVPAASEPQSLALPAGFGGFNLSGVTIDGVAAATAQQPITGRATDFINVGPGSHTIVATYNAPITLPPVAVNDTASTWERQPVAVAVLANDYAPSGDAITLVSTTPGAKGSVAVNANQTVTYTPSAGTCGTDQFTYTISGSYGTASATVTVSVACVHTTGGDTLVTTDLGGACGMSSNTMVTRASGNAEIRLAGVHGDEYNGSTLDPTQWVAGTWTGGAYSPAPAGGVLSIAGGTTGVYVRSATSMPVTTLEASVQFSGAAWEHVGWGTLDLSGAYALFSTFNTTTTLFARSYTPTGEVQTNLGPIPAGFHVYRIDRQVASSTTDQMNYYVDGVLRAQHTVPTQPAMYIYQSHNGGSAPTLNIDRVWVYPSYVSAGTYQSCTLDAGVAMAHWTVANRNATVPAGTTLQLTTRTSSDGVTWSPWSVALTGAGQATASPPGRYLQFQLAMTSSNPSVSPVVTGVALLFTDPSATPFDAGSCAVSANAIVTHVGGSEIRLAGVSGNEYSGSTLDPTQWTAGTWSGGTYAPTPSGGMLSIAGANGVYVRSVASMPVTTLEATVRFSAAPWEHVGWGTLNFSGAYAVFSTYNTTTTLFARTYTPSGELQTNLGPLPSGFHIYRIDRQIVSSTSDQLSYYIDGALRAQHLVPTLPAMYIYQSHNGGIAPTLDLTRIWVYPSYVASGSFQSCTMDSGSAAAPWTIATWGASVPANTTLQILTRTSVDGSTWSPWSAPLTSSGQPIMSPPGRYLQYQLQMTSSDPNQSPIVNNVTFLHGPPPVSVGLWTDVISWPLVDVHSALLPTGDVVMWDAWELPDTLSGRVWHPGSGTFSPAPVPGSALFCAGHSFLADGRPLVIGGHHGGDTGIPNTNLFNTPTGSWVALAPMSVARWYPTSTTLSDGRVLAIGGEITPTVEADVPEVYDPAANTWTTLPGARLVVGEYPSMFVLPNGKLFMVAGDPDLRSRTLDLASQTWTLVGQSPVPSGTSAMYRPGKILVAGGGTGNSDPVQAGTAVIDMTQPTPAWRATAPMQFARTQHNLVILPDGKILAVGGSDMVSLNSITGILPTETWDPQTEAWMPSAGLQQLRMYHSIALLLPDGRVLSAGGGRVGAPVVDYLSAQIYSPPYLFKGARPLVASAPGFSPYSAIMSVATPDAASVSSVSLIRLPSVTHHHDMDQRFMNLSFTPSSNGLNIQSPIDANTAPPGDYMLFLVNGNGVPSVGTVVRLGASPPSDLTPPTIALTAPADGAVVSALTSIAATAVDNVGVVSVQFAIDGIPLGDPITTSPFTTSWDPTTAPTGSHVITAQAKDAAGNSASSRVTVTVSR
jgi:hypothetical protein